MLPLDDDADEALRDLLEELCFWLLSFRGRFDCDALESDFRGVRDELRDDTPEELSLANQESWCLTT